ncbi:MAG: hypothetical protein ACO1QR_16500 [Chthoniobacteraceae bacterium]
MNADLQDHQNPDKPSFWENGYGFELARQETGSADLRYIVLGAKEELKLKEPLILTQSKRHSVLGKHWSSIPIRVL